jgi:hypothetical protein
MEQSGASLKPPLVEPPWETYPNQGPGRAFFAIVQTKARLG